MPIERQHSFTFDNNTLTVKGVAQVVEISEKEAIFKLENNTLTVKGSGLNVIKLDKEQGIVTLEVSALAGLVYRQSGLSIRGLFR